LTRYCSDDLNSVFERYCYDGLNRLTTSATKATDPTTCSATGAGVTAKTIAYDQVGNITSKSDVGTYSYPSSGSARPHAISSITGTVNGVTNPSYTYDANGNMTVSAGRTVTYTAFNMAASIIQGTIADCLAYDSNHARIKMEVRASTCGGTLSATTYYLNDPISGAMSEKLVAGGTTKWYDYVAAGGGIVAERSCTGATPCSSGATWSFFVSDHLGSIAVITNAAGTATEQLSYDAWGRRRNLNGTDNSACSITSATSRGYTGHEMLDSICEINANARIYDPTVARFMSPDPIIANPFNGQAFNRYSYVLNNPLALVDPSGFVPNDTSAPKVPIKYWIDYCAHVCSTGSHIPGGCYSCDLRPMWGVAQGSSSSLGGAGSGSTASRVGLTASGSSGIYSDGYTETGWSEGEDANHVETVVVQDTLDTNGAGYILVAANGLMQWAPWGDRPLSVERDNCHCERPLPSALHIAQGVLLRAILERGTPDMLKRFQNWDISYSDYNAGQDYAFTSFDGQLSDFYQGIMRLDQSGVNFVMAHEFSHLLPYNNSLRVSGEFGSTLSDPVELNADREASFLLGVPIPK
jgi:RHS repeat-associated protein